MWSDIQWHASQAVVRTQDGWIRNCCSQCAEQVGEYFTSRVQLRPPTPFNEDQLRGRYASSTHWLRMNVPCCFWDKFSQYLAEQNVTHRDGVAYHNKKEGLSDGVSLLKRMSYVGALHLADCLWKGFDIQPSWIDPVTKNKYLDPGNWIYGQVFRTVWATSFVAQYSARNIGDHIEAFSGYYFTCKEKAPFPYCIDDFVGQLEMACLSAAALYFYYKVSV